MSTILNFIFPQRCVSCNSLGTYICLKCRKQLTFRPPPCPECDRPAIDGVTHPRCLRPQGLDGLITAFYYQGVMKKLIKAIKYRFIYDMAQATVDLVAWKHFPELVRFSSDAVLYPIPLHRDRLKWRGFNQAEKLGEVIAKRLNVKMINGLLIRKEKRMPQADISHREDRIKNAQGLFTKNSQLENSKLENILLFDDVWTTGATMKEACKVLKRGGVSKVWGFTIAR